MIAFALCGLAQADSVVCHITYGGETRLIEAQPVSSSYTVAPTPIGSYFLFRIVFRQEPADLDRIARVVPETVRVAARHRLPESLRAGRVGEPETAAQRHFVLYLVLITFCFGGRGTHQESYPYPVKSVAPAGDFLQGTDSGFTGLNWVYETVRDSELQYWCELKSGTLK